MSCKSCTGTGADECDACHEGSTNVSGVCQCDSGVREPEQFRCVDSCAFGFEDIDGLCTPNAMYHSETVSASVGLGTPTVIYGAGRLDFDSGCHPPVIRQNTFLFNDDSTTLEVKGLINSNGFIARSWFLAHDAQDTRKSTVPAVIFALQAAAWDQYGAWENYGETCHLNNEIRRTTFRVAFGLDECFRGMISLTENAHEIE